MAHITISSYLKRERGVYKVSAYGLRRRWVHYAVNDAMQAITIAKYPYYGCSNPTPQYPTTPEYAVFHSLDSCRVIQYTVSVWSTEYGVQHTPSNMES
jgi:hypothetical protein